jgi:hypothetical protein
MVTVESKIINIHGERIELDDDVPEVQDLVVATAAMPLADWRRTRSLLLDDRAAALRQAVPDPADPGARHLGHLLPRHDRGLHGRRSQALPMIAEINAFFDKEAESIQQGGSEYVFSKEYLGIYWPATSSSSSS